MKKYTGEIYEGLKIRVSFYKNPGAWTENAIYEIEEIVSGLGFKQIKFKGYNLLHDLTNLIFSEINAFAPAPIKEDAKHTAGEFDLNTMPLPSRKVIELRKNHTVIAELKQTIKGKIYTEDHDPELKANAVFLLQAVNSYPTLLKENEQLKEQVNVLREALKEASTILVHSINNEKGNKIKTAILKECPDVRDMMKMIRNVLSQTN